MELWQAIITSPSGQEESPHGVYKPTRDSRLGQPVFTARVLCSCFPPSPPACCRCYISVSREAPTPDARLIPPRGEGPRFLDDTVPSPLEWDHYPRGEIDGNIFPIVWVPAENLSRGGATMKARLMGGVLNVEICCLHKFTSLWFQSSKTSGFYRHLHF
jgi:hypothetical protein